MKDIRLNQMEQYILQQETVSMEALCERFQVSLNTVRRDVARLLAKGSVEKIYGGVRARKSELLQPFDVRTAARQEAKMAIGRKAASLVADGDVIFVDSGTTTLHMIPQLWERQEVTLVTNSLHAIMAAMPYPNLNVISLPGQLQRKTSSFTGPDAVRFLNGYNIRKAFMAATGWSLSHGVTNSSPLEYELKRTALARSQQRILLLDHHKFGTAALLSYAQPDAFQTLVTDRVPPEAYAKALAEADVQCLVAGEG